MQTLLKRMTLSSREKARKENAMSPSAKKQLHHLPRLAAIVVVLPLMMTAFAFLAAPTSHAAVKAHAAEMTIGGRWVKPPGNGIILASPGGAHGSMPVCREWYDGGQHPGKLWDGTCNFGWGGRTIYATDYELLVDDGYSWVTAHNDGMPGNAVDGGDAGNAAGHVRLGVCQVFNGGDGSWHPGKFYADKCNYAWGGSKNNNLGKEIAAVPNGNVQILVKP